MSLSMDANPSSSPSAASSTVGGQTDGGGQPAAVPTQQATGGGATPAGTPTPGQTGGTKPEPLHTDPEFKGAIDRKNQALKQAQDAENLARQRASELAYYNQQLEQVRSQAQQRGVQIPVDHLEDGVRQPIEAVASQTAALNQTVEAMSRELFGMHIARQLDALSDELKSQGLPDNVDELIPEMNKLHAQYPRMPMKEIYWAINGPKAIVKNKSVAAQEVINQIQANRQDSQTQTSVPTAAFEPAGEDYDSIIRREYRKITAGK